MKHITFICTGNICRSPIAEGLFRARTEGRGIEVNSVGTHALVGQSADPFAVEAMRINGHDISGHRARQATSSLLLWADLILAMDHSHIEWAVIRMPELRGRIFRLGKWQNELDVVDPYRQPIDAFVDTYTTISSVVDDWIARI